MASGARRLSRGACPGRREKEGGGRGTRQGRRSKKDVVKEKATERSRKRRSKRVLWASNSEGVGDPERDWQQLSSTLPTSLLQWTIEGKEGTEMQGVAKEIIGVGPLEGREEVP